jgi:hypothetical protein
VKLLLFVVICLAVVVSGAVLIVLLSAPIPGRDGAPTQPSPTADWAKCVPLAPRACTIVGGVALGPSWGPVSLDTPRCDNNCRDSAGAAVGGLERLAPNHPQVTAIDRFGPDLHILCGELRCMTGGTLEIFLFSVAGGAALPIVVTCSGIYADCSATPNYSPINPTKEAPSG